MKFSIPFALSSSAEAGLPAMTIIALSFNPLYISGATKQYSSSELQITIISALIPLQTLCLHRLFQILLSIICNRHIRKSWLRIVIWLFSSQDFQLEEEIQRAFCSIVNRHSQLFILLRSPEVNYWDQQLVFINRLLLNILFMSACQKFSPEY